jgi:hypothetical protein
MQQREWTPPSRFARSNTARLRRLAESEIDSSALSTCRIAGDKLNCRVANKAPACLRDHRVKAIHSQVGAMDGRTGWDESATRAEATRYARGQQTYPAPYKKVVGNLIGAPRAGIRGRCSARRAARQENSRTVPCRQTATHRFQNPCGTSGRYRVRLYADANYSYGRLCIAMELARR